MRNTPTSYLSVSRFSLIRALEETLSAYDKKMEVNDWRAFAESMAFVVGCSYATVMEGMKRYAWQEHGADASTSDLHSYISRLLSLLSAAQYKPMSEAQWNLGVAPQSGASGQRVHVNIKAHAPIFREYWDTHSYWFGDLLDEARPEFSDRVLLFYRGMSEIEHTGLYLSAKITYLAARVSAWVAVVVNFFRPAPAEEKEDGTSPSSKRAGGADIFAHNTALQASYAQSIFEGKPLREVTLEGHIKQVGLLRAMLSRITLVEPAFNNVILVYPRKRAVGKEAAPQDAPRQKPEMGDVEESELLSAIQVESYRRVPFRDLGLLIPGRDVTLSYVLKFRFACEIAVSVLLILSCLYSLVFHNTSGWLAVDLEIVLMFVFLVCLLFFTAHLAHSMMEWKTRVESSLQDWHDQRLVGKGHTFVTSLVSEVQEQELKEVLLGYFLLWRSVDPLTQRQLDVAAEETLLNNFRLETDFEVEDALQKLVKLALVEEVGGKFRCAQTPRDYLDDPVPRWLPFVHAFFDFDEKEDDETDVLGMTVGGLSSASASRPLLSAAASTINARPVLSPKAGMLRAPSLGGTLRRR